MRMKNKRVFRLLTSLLAVVLCTTAFSVTAFAGGGEDFYVPPTEDTEVAADDTAEPEVGEDTAEPTEGGIADLLSWLAGAKVTFSITEDGIQIDTGGSEDAEPAQTGTVTTNGGRLNVRTGAGLDHTAFTQLPNGTTVEVVGEDGDWLKIILPERIGYVHSDYMTVSDAEMGADGGLSFSIDPGELEALLGMFGGALPDDVGAALSPDGNLSLIDDIGSSTTSGKQFITVESKNGNVFYLIIDRDDEGEETVHFLNQVDEADLMALTEEGEAAEKPIVCSCTDKCQAGAVNTACKVCMTNMSECVGEEPEPITPDEPEEPVEEKKGGAGAIVAVVLIL
ncbi:MAG: DUF4366 domain-containing protein, partial [Clostridia bacterium]|nr:DUF4366 domain-containing protein [Clostridia bacterium]